MTSGSNLTEVSVFVKCGWNSKVHVFIEWRRQTVCIVRADIPTLNSPCAIVVAKLYCFECGKGFETRNGPIEMFLNRPYLFLSVYGVIFRPEYHLNFGRRVHFNGFYLGVLN